MSQYSLFMNQLLYGYPDDVPDAFFSRWSDAYSINSRYNIKSKELSSVLLDDGDTKAITLTDSVLADWITLTIRIIGTARLDIVAKDTDGTTTINSYLGAYGTDNLPGYITLSTYNITSLTLLGQEDGTIIQVFAGICEEDA